MSDWIQTLSGLHAGTWDLLEAGAHDSDSPLHLASLATVGLGGGGEARMVILRGADRDEARLETHVDRASHKVDELESVPLATLLFWDAANALQIRARVRIEVDTGDAAREIWDSLSDRARRNYGGAPPPSTPLPDPDTYRETAERDRFAVLRANVTSLDVLHLGSMHRRALYEADNGFEGMWLAP